ncbi:MAG: hypothetical protein AABZ39_04465 [Spirochaetota bacterium]
MSTLIARVPIFILMMFMSVGCATISNRDDVCAIRTIAIVSMSINAEPFNVNGAMQKAVDGRSAAMSASPSPADTTRSSLGIILVNFSAIVKEEFQALPHWRLVPIELAKDMAAYKAAPGEPIEGPGQDPSMVIPDTRYFDPFRKDKRYAAISRSNLTVLCNGLGMDAVMVIRQELAYRPAVLRPAGGGDRTGVKSLGTPMVGTAIAVITKEGRAAVWMPASIEDAAEDVPMLESGRVNFTGDDAKCVVSYNKAIAASVKSLVKRIVEEMNAK